MKVLKWLTWLQWLGVVAAVLVVAWWAMVFHFVGQQTGESLSGYVACMVAPTADCNLLRGMAWLRGINPYEPLAFWWAASVAVIAWVTKRTVVKDVAQ
jgi:hypothetical protein